MRYVALKDRLCAYVHRKYLNTLYIDPKRRVKILKYKPRISRCFTFLPDLVKHEIQLSKINFSTLEVSRDHFFQKLDHKPRISRELVKNTDLVFLDVLIS